MKLINWIPNEVFEKNNDLHFRKLLNYDIVENYTSEHPDFNSCPLKLRKIIKWAIISNTELTYIIACNERTDGSIIIRTKII